MTAALAKDLEQAANSVVEAVEQHTAQIGDLRQGAHDHQTQLLVHAQSVQAIRTEVLARLDQVEVTMLVQFQQLQARLQNIALALGMNGSGGSHG